MNRCRTIILTVIVHLLNEMTSLNYKLLKYASSNLSKSIQPIIASKSMSIIKCFTMIINNKWPKWF